MSRMLFINLPVSDMERSKRFYEAIGARNEPKFSNEHGSMMRFSDQIAVMLLKAVTAFQTSQGLTPDGKVGQRT
jgi:predicted lactoylglutathione lyase